jgi:hypothetical protein
MFFGYVGDPRFDQTVRNAGSIPSTLKLESAKSSPKQDKHLRDHLTYQTKFLNIKAKQFFYLINFFNLCTYVEKSPPQGIACLPQTPQRHHRVLA